VWLYAAVEPATGEGCVLLLPRTDGARLEIFLGAFRAAVPDGTVALVLDGSGGHTSGRVSWPAGLERLPLPAYSPELNPVERLFAELRAALSHRVFESLAELERALTAALRRYRDDPPALRRLTGRQWWVEGVNNITPPPR
jgi:transposase